MTSFVPFELNLSCFIDPLPGFATTVRVNADGTITVDWKDIDKWLDAGFMAKPDDPCFAIMVLLLAARGYIENVDMARSEAIAKAAASVLTS